MGGFTKDLPLVSLHYMTVERATYTSSETFFSPNFFISLQKRKTVTFCQLVNTVFRAKGQEVS